MKKLIAGLLILIITISAVSAFEMEVYGGVGVEFYNAEGFKNTRLSDKKYQGSLYGAQYNEGSLLLNLASMNGFGTLITIQGGARYEVIPNLYALGEACLGFISIDTYALQFEGGALFMFPASLFVSNLHVGVGAKAGFFDFTKSLGKAKILENTTGPVILPEGKIYENYLIEFSSLGLSVTPFIDLTFDLSKYLAVGVDVGFQWAISFKSALYAKKDKDSSLIEVNTKSGVFYEPRADALVPMDMDPVVSLTGLKANAHVTYRW